MPLFIPLFLKKRRIKTSKRTDERCLPETAILPYFHILSTYINGRHVMYSVHNTHEWIEIYLFSCISETQPHRKYKHAIPRHINTMLFNNLLELSRKYTFYRTRALLKYLFLALARWIILELLSSLLKKLLLYIRTFKISFKELVYWQMKKAFFDFFNYYYIILWVMWLKGQYFC